MVMFCLAFALLQAVASPPAPAPPAMAAPDAAAMKAAERMLDALEYDKMMQQMADAMVADQRKQVLDKIEAEAGEPLPDGLKNDIGNAMEGSMRRMFRDSSGNLRRGSALIYARHFTAGEIERMIELNSDPVMRKSQSVMPQVIKDLMALTEAMVAAELPRLKREIEAIVARHADLSDQPS